MQGELQASGREVKRLSRGVVTQVPCIFWRSAGPPGSTRLAEVQRRSRGAGSAPLACPGPASLLEGAADPVP